MLRGQNCQRKQRLWFLDRAPICWCGTSKLRTMRRLMHSLQYSSQRIHQTPHTPCNFWILEVCQHPSTSINIQYEVFRLFPIKIWTFLYISFEYRWYWPSTHCLGPVPLWCPLVPLRVPPPGPWARLLAEAALEQLEFSVAEKAFVRFEDYQALESVGSVELGETWEVPQGFLKLELVDVHIFHRKTIWTFEMVD